MTDPAALALVQALVENPADLATRAVLADRLLELDDVRGRMIQLDLEMRDASSDDAARAFQHQIDSIVIEHGRTLAGDIATHADRFDFAGGFVDHITATASIFKNHGEPWFLREPIRSFAPKPWNTAAIKTLAKCKHLGRVRALRLEKSGPNKVSRVAMAPLATAALDRLESLEITWADFVDEDAEIFLRDLRAPRLHRLRISSSSFGERALRGLAANRALCAQLRSLDLTLLDHEAADADALRVADEAVANIALPVLESLRLDYSWFATESRIATILATTPALQFLETNRADDAVLEALGRCTHLQKFFSISRPPRPAALAALLALPALRELLISGADTWPGGALDAVIDTLVALPRTHPLREVHLMHPPQRLRDRFKA